ncbi:MAG: hypothetical protein JJT85_07020 [Chromatiales bacterium]|nr:hypothetical protein [Chromatiales bacterium]
MTASPDQNRRFSGPAAFLASFVLSFAAAGSATASVPIANAPLFLTTNVEPNVLFVLDDSGSMMWETIPDELTYRFFNGNINSLLFWLYPPVFNLHGGGEYYGTGNANWGRLPRFSGDDFSAFVRSSRNNPIFYNPAITYLPWVNADGTLMAPSVPTAAMVRPLFPGLGTVNLTAEFNHSRWWNGNGTTTNALMTVFPATYYHYEGGDPELATSYTQVEIRPENGPFVGQGRQNRSDCAGNTAEPPFCTYAEEIQNFANWYSYHRNRVFASRAGIGRAFAGFDGGMRVGYGTINHARTGTAAVDGVNGRTVVRGVRPFTGADKDAFFDELYTRPIPAQGTPLRRALEGAGEYFSRADARGPWSSTPGVLGGEDLACRQSFTILMTDGYTTGTLLGSGYGAADASRRANVDGTTAGNTVNINPNGPDFVYDPADPFNDNFSHNLADVAMYYWKRDLRPDLPNRVPTSERNEAFWQHMVTYGIGLGVTGSIDPDTAFQAARDGTFIAWPDPEWNFINCGNSPDARACPARIDDLLHAAVNSRGGFFSAMDPDTFARELGDVLEDIIARVDASATSAATSSAVLQSDTLLYTAGFRSGDWSGRLDARQVNTDGSLGAVAWDAEQRLAARTPASRKIYARRDDSGTTVLFDFANLSATQQAALSTNPANIFDGLGAQRVEWLRGSESAHASFRSRSESGEPRLLGDIVNSNPKFRNGVLFVAANDGMLHAFDASNGEEIFAYIPSTLLVPEPGNAFAPLSQLMAEDYSHRYFFDGTPSVVTFDDGGVDRTVLVVSLGAGGRTVVALDVTDPYSFGAGSVMWEFTHPEMGYNVGPPAIVKLSTGAMAAVFGNGYNSNSQQARLFVVDLATGALIQQINTGVGSFAVPNGLAAPSVTDWPVSNLRASRVYAGDLQGRLWRFDLTGSPTLWNEAGRVQVLFQAESPSGEVQPVTTAPVIALNPEDSDQIIVAFGTGSYFRITDQDMPGATVQSLYGIIDDKLGRSGIDRDGLVEQTITTQTIASFGGFNTGIRQVSENPLVLGIDDGWLLDLTVEDGERVISSPTFPSGPNQRRVRFSTLIPDDDPCGTGRRGFLMELDLLSGGRTNLVVFDLNRDGMFDDDDKFLDAPVSGVAWGQGELPTALRPSESAGDPPEFLYTGEGDFTRGRGQEGIGGRQSWQQLR